VRGVHLCEWEYGGCCPGASAHSPSCSAQVIERIKTGYSYLLPNICEELNAKFPTTDGAPGKPYGQCMTLLSGLSQWGADVRHWLHMGCYKIESYGSMELIQPCPTHAICAKVSSVPNKRAVASCHSRCCCRSLICPRCPSASGQRWTAKSSRRAQTPSASREQQSVLQDKLGACAHRVCACVRVHVRVRV
jgi:hypothetical protein